MGDQAEQGRIPWRCDSLNICEEKRPNLVLFSKPYLHDMLWCDECDKDIHHFSVSGQERKMKYVRLAKRGFVAV